MIGRVDSYKDNNIIFKKLLDKYLTYKILPSLRSLILFIQLNRWNRLQRLFFFILEIIQYSSIINLD